MQHGFLQKNIQRNRTSISWHREPPILRHMALQICSLQEMQWMDCGYLNSAEYFHGPFEVTDEDHLYILMMSRGRNRMECERVLIFP